MIACGEEWGMGVDMGCEEKSECSLRHYQGHEVDEREGYEIRGVGEICDWRCI